METARFFKQDFEEKRRGHVLASESSMHRRRFMTRVRRFSKYIQVHSSTSKYIQVQCTWLQVHPSTVYLASSTSKYSVLGFKYIQVHSSTMYLKPSMYTVQECN